SRPGSSGRARAAGPVLNGAAPNVAVTRANGRSVRLVLVGERSVEELNLEPPAGKHAVAPLVIRAPGPHPPAGHGPHRVADRFSVVIGRVVHACLLVIRSWFYSLPGVSDISVVYCREHDDRNTTL